MLKKSRSKKVLIENYNGMILSNEKCFFFNGGKLSFKYQEDPYLVKMGAEERRKRGIKSTYRMLPIVEDMVVKNHYEMIRLTNKKQVEKWFNNSDYTDTVFIEDTDDNEIIFKVPENKKDDFCSDLEGQGFRFND